MRTNLLVQKRAELPVFSQVDVPQLDHNMLGLAGTQLRVGTSNGNESQSPGRSYEFIPNIFIILEGIFTVYKS